MWWGVILAKLNRNLKGSLQFCGQDRQEIKKNSTLDHSLGLKIGTHIGLMTLHNRKDQIFDFLIFWSFLSLFGVKKSENPAFWRQKRAKKTEKSKNQKFDPCDCGGSSDQCVYQFLAPGSDLVLSFFDFWRKKSNFFSGFSIYYPEKVRVGANFVASHLSNRWELRRKWAHFGN